MGVFLLTDLKKFLLSSKISDNFFGNSSPLQQKGENTQTKHFFTHLLQFNLLLCNNDAIVFIGNFRWVSDFLYFLILLWLIGGKGGFPHLNYWRGHVPGLFPESTLIID